MQVPASSQTLQMNDFTRPTLKLTQMLRTQETPKCGGLNPVNSLDARDETKDVTQKSIT